MRLFFVLLLASSALAAQKRDARKCARVILARAADSAGEFRMPRLCPDIVEKDFPKGYHVTPVRHGVDVLSGPIGIVAVFLAPEPKTKPVRAVAPSRDDCPRAPPGYRMVHALVKETP